MRVAWSAAMLALVGLVGIGMWSAVTPSTGEDTTNAVDAIVVDADPDIVQLATSGREARAAVGTGYAGSWIDANGQLQVSATSAESLARVQGDGVNGRLVDYSAAELGRIVDTLNATTLSATNPLSELSTGWTVNVIENRVEIETNDPGAVRDLLRSMGVAESAVQFVPAVERQTFQRGAEIYDEFASFIGWAGWAEGSSPSLGCSMGVPVTGGFVSAAHCARHEGTPIGFVGTEGTVGRVERSLFSQNYDGAFIRLDAPHVVDPAVPATGGAGPTPILGLAEAPVGSSVCKIGLRTGRTCGTILSRNHTSTGVGHPFYGNIQTDLCADAGDSGGVLMWGNQIQGIVSTGSVDGECGSSYAPINYMLDQFDVDLITPNGPVPHLANYEDVADTFEEAGGLELPGPGGSTTPTPPTSVVPELPRPGSSPSSDVPVLPPALPPATPGNDAPELPGADSSPSSNVPVLPPATPGNDVPVLPPATPGNDVPVLPPATPSDDLPVLPAADPPLAPRNPPSTSTSTSTVPLTPDPISQPLRTNLLVNGSFEAVTLPIDTLLDVQQTGWSTSRAGNLIETWEATYEQVGAPDGRHLIELNGDQADAISQSIPSIPGSRYHISFSHRGRVDTDRVRLLVNGAEIGISEAAPGVWSAYLVAYIAQPHETALTIELVSLDVGTSVGNLLDNIQVVRAS